MTPLLDRRVFSHYVVESKPAMSAKEQLELIEALKEEVRRLKEANQKLQEKLHRE